MCSARSWADSGVTSGEEDPWPEETGSPGEGTRYGEVRGRRESGGDRIARRWRLSRDVHSGSHFSVPSSAASHGWTAVALWCARVRNVGPSCCPAPARPSRC